MTTPAAAALYEAQRVYEHENSKVAVFNPHSKPLLELPVIYGFNNGGPHGFMDATLIAADGEFLGSHCCTSEAYMRADLGILEGTREDRHETFKKHYPGGYRMEFVSYSDVPDNVGLNDAFILNRKKRDESVASTSIGLDGKDQG